MNLGQCAASRCLGAEKGEPPGSPFLCNSHTAEVTASSLFEAVAQGLSALRKNEWVEGIEERFGFVKVSVADVRVEHQVKIADFMKWLERPGRTPREIKHRLRIRAILGMSVSR